MNQGQADRKYWIGLLTRIIEPVLSNLAEGTLKKNMPVEAKKGQRDRHDYSHLEAFGRTVAGIAPWLESKSMDKEEETLRQRYAELTRKAMDMATDPASADYLNFSKGFQPIVDTAFLCHGILRAPIELWEKLEDRVKQNLVKALQATRRRKPHFNNWLLFSAMIETALYKMGQDWDPMRVDYAIRQHESWYAGDGAYGDGPHFHWDYYNSFVIQPMLVDIMLTVGDYCKEWEAFKPAILERAKRYSGVLERFISPEGTFPPIGRSLPYRAGAFQHLAQMALQHNLPSDVTAEQVRCALTAVMKRTLEAKGTFDEEGWLTIGLCGHQKDIGETYISTGSLYLCTTAFLPLGLIADDPFWKGKPQDWTSKKIWNGENYQADHAL